MEEPRRMSLPDHGLRNDHETGSAGREGKASKPIRYERCLDSPMNDVLNYDTLGSTAKVLVIGMFAPRSIDVDRAEFHKNFTWPRQWPLRDRLQRPEHPSR
jgi:hypothetical protein